MDSKQKHDNPHTFVVGPYARICELCGREVNDYQYHYHPTARELRVQAIRESIENGTYQVASEDVARALIEKMESPDAPEDLKLLKRSLEDLWR